MLSSHRLLEEHMFTGFLAVLVATFLITPCYANTGNHMEPRMTEKRAKMVLSQVGVYSTMSPHELAQKLLQQECVENFSGCEKEDYIENSSALIGHRIEMSSNYFEFNYKYCASKCVPADWPGSDLYLCGQYLQHHSLIEYNRYFGGTGSPALANPKHLKT